MRPAHAEGRGWRSRHRTWTVLVGAALLAGCDFSVTNPGPVQDEYLNQAAAHTALVNGMGRDLADALNWVSYTGAAVTREIHPAGSTGSFGISPLQQLGVLEFDDLHVSDIWDLSQRARWVAEDGIRRLRETLGEAAESSVLVAQAHLWAAYANRMLGENMCEAVIDGGPAQPRTEYLNRAQTNFTQAMEIAARITQPAAAAARADTIARAARAGRASVRVHLGDWAGAVSDAAQIPTAFAYQLPYHNRGVLAEYNRIFEASGNSPYRAHTVWNTVNQQYFLDTNDPRVRWLQTALTGDAAVGQLGRVPWLPQQKHATRTSPINLSTGREMRLIEAEALLRGGDWQGAMNIINSLRTSIGVVPWTATSAEEAWTRLKRERGIELWLEGRRLGDMRRWIGENAPGAFDPLEVEGGQLPLRPNLTYCFPIAQSERQTNPNFTG